MASSKISRPSRSNANTHPGQRVLDSQQKRRTKAQIKADEAAAAEAAAAKRAMQEEAIQRIADVEDMMAAEDEIRSIDRPDLIGASAHLFLSLYSNDLLLRIFDEDLPPASEIEESDSVAAPTSK